MSFVFCWLELSSLSAIFIFIPLSSLIGDFFPVSVMDCSGLVLEKFVKYVREEDVFSNELIVPPAFCLKHIGSMPTTIKLSVRNGYEIWLDVDKVNGKLIGMRRFYEDFGVEPGQTLMFVYVGGFDMNVFIFGFDDAEIDYPLIVHPLQKSSAKHVYADEGEFSFVKVVRCGRHIIDEFVLPESFVDRVGFTIPSSLEYVVKGGEVFVGSYTRERSAISGMASFCKFLGKPHLSCFSRLVFTFDGCSTFQITAFAGSMIETELYPIVPPSFDPLVQSTAFHILANETDMLPFISSVEIRMKYRNLSLLWDKRDTINVYLGDRSWELSVRMSNKRTTTTITAGWQELRSDLGLEKGDLCVFEWKNETVRNFNMCVFRNIAPV
ncbi:hypothetical protein ACET3Z_011188 [Daucus carota]